MRTKSVTSDELRKKIDQFLDLMVEERKHNKLLNFIEEKDFKTKFKDELFRETGVIVNQFIQRFDTGLNLLIQNLKNDDHVTSRIINELQTTIDSIYRNRLKPSLVGKRLKQSETISEFIGFSKETLNDFFSVARNFYQNKDFNRASDCFYSLCAIEPLIPLFWLGYGDSEMMLHKFDHALYAYAVSALLDGDDPYSHYQAALCYDSLNDISNAKNSLDLVFLCSNENDKNHDIRKAAQELKLKYKRHS